MKTTLKFSREDVLEALVELAESKGVTVWNPELFFVGTGGQTVDVVRVELEVDFG
jgi:hypothetical protein